MAQQDGSEAPSLRAPLRLRLRVGERKSDNGSCAMSGQVQAPPIRVPTHNLTRYLRTTIEVSDNTVRWTVPRTILGLMRIGLRLVAVPVDDVVSIRVGRAVSPLRLVIGLGGAILPWFFLPWWAALPLLLLGLWVTLVALGPQLILATQRNETHRAPVCFGHQLDAELYISVVEDLAAESGAGQQD